MTNNKLFESAGALLTETEDDTIYGSKVAVDAAADDAFIASDEMEESNDIGETVKELSEKLAALKDEIRSLFNNSHEALVDYGSNVSADELYTLYAAVYGNLKYDDMEDFYNEFGG